jgi:hypothetical protein
MVVAKDDVVNNEKQSLIVNISTFRTYRLKSDPKTLDLSFSYRLVDGVMEPTWYQSK